MSRRGIARVVGLVALCGLGLFPTGRARAGMVYQVSVDLTSTAALGQFGYISFQYNPFLDPVQPGGSQPTTTTITDFAFTGGGSFGGPAIPAVITYGGYQSGDLSMDPNGPLLINNTTNAGFGSGADFEANFGTGFGFTLTLSGPAIDSPDPGNINGTSFVRFLYQTDDATPWVSTFGDGTILHADVASGSDFANAVAPLVTTSSFDPGLVSAGFADIVPQGGGSAVPAPPSLVLLLIGGALALPAGRTRRWLARAAALLRARA